MRAQVITLHIYCFWAGDRLYRQAAGLIYVFESLGYDVNQDCQGAYVGAPVDAQKFDFGVAIII
jgi:hypothetical protein